MKPTHFVCLLVLAISLLSVTVLAGDTQPSPSPTPAVTAVKKAHVRKVEKNMASLTVFDLLSIMLSNLGIL